MDSGIDFSNERWHHIRQNYDMWWRGELDRPLISITVGGRDPGREEPTVPGYDFAAFYDDSVSADQIVDRWDYDLSRNYYLGDSFPTVHPNFGPGVIAAFLGADVGRSVDAGTVWFHPKERKDISDIHLKYDPDNKWLKRVSDICRAARSRWNGMVQLGMTDLGGNLDVVSSFRPSEELLFDLYDHPDEVKRVLWDIHDLWFRYFNELDSISRSVSHGYTSWASIFSSEPFYMLQCDFSYMISPEMFDEFVRPELVASCRKIANPFYHLDGPGQLPHLDSLLSIEELKGIQWIPGDGAPDYKHWPEIYRRIRDAGKLIQIFGGLDTIDVIADQLGSGRGIVYIGWTRDKDEAVRLLSKYGVS